MSIDLRITRAALRLTKLMEDLGHERFTMLDSFSGEKPHVMVIAVTTPEHCAKITRQLKKWLELPKKRKKP
jgi:hypothetical protein